MATYQITAPDGKTYKVNAPEGASPEDVKAYVMSQSGAPVSKDEPKEEAPAIDFSGMTLRPFGIDTGIELPESGAQFLAGAGKAFADLGRGAGQLVGLVDSEEVAEANKRDQDLMNTGWGMAGNLTGNVAAFLPSITIPGANTVTGAGLIGAGAGLLMPTEEDSVVEGKLSNAGEGFLWGAGPMALLRGGKAAYQGGKSLLEPFFKKGQEAIVGRTLHHAANNADDVVTNLSRHSDTIPGYKATVAEATQDPGMAILQRGAGSVDEAGHIGLRDSENVMALKQAVRDIAGDDVAMNAAKTARREAASPLYESAKRLEVDADDELMSLMDRGIMKNAWKKADDLAKANGEVLGVVDQEAGIFTGKGLHYLKLALDDMAEAGPQNKMGSNMRDAVKRSSDDLAGWLEKNLTPYGDARRTYAEMSKPINQMQIGKLLDDKLSPALDDFHATPRASASSYARAVKNDGKTVKQATGMSMPLEKVMSPEQMQTINNVGTNLAKRASVADLARGPGSNTAQNLASQNILRQTLGPMGMPKNWMEANIWRTLLSPVDFVSRAQSPAINGLLTEALTDPKVALKLMQGHQPAVPAGLLMNKAGKAILPASLGANASKK